MAAPIPQHAFTGKILEILQSHFGEYSQDIFTNSQLVGYLNFKTKSANKGSKARGAFANHYALYVVIEDYINKGFFDGKAKFPYSKYEGARFTDLFKRQRELPFGSKLQNHALNGRCNDEFRKYFPTLDKNPIVRDAATQRYWIQEDLLLVSIRKKDGKDYEYNTAPIILEIIDAYVATKKEAFEGFIEVCKQIAKLGQTNPTEAIKFVVSQLEPSVDARVFEIISFAVLKAKYGQESVWIGQTREGVTEEDLILYKTGRTNANDGGIDFVMKPLGRFFQVTETVDVTKYFLDIDKVQRFPITFVVKSTDSSDQIKASIKQQATVKYKIDAVVNSYMDAVEEIINVNYLISAFEQLVKSDKLNEVMEEIIIQSKVEFNYNEEESDDDEEIA